MTGGLARSAPLLILLILAALLAYGLVFHRRHTPAPSLLLGKPLPDFAVPLLGQEGRHFSPALWHGQVAILVIFASWCAPCAQEHPTLLRLAQRTPTPLYGLAWRDAPQQSADWLAAHGNPYRQVGSDRTGQTTVALALTGVPETLVLDRHGTVAYDTALPLSDDDIDHVILPLLEKLHAQ